MTDETKQTESDAGEPGTVQEEQEATRYPGHEDPDALRQRAGLDENPGRTPEVSPDVDGESAASS